MVMGFPLPMTNSKKNNGVYTMNKQNRKQKHKQYREQIKIIEEKLNDTSSKGEAKLLLKTLIFHFDGFARQQKIVNEHMSLKYHWGNKRTARVLKTLSVIGVLARSRSESDNWTLFFLVKGFIEKCRERILQAGLAIKKRLNRSSHAILSIGLRRVRRALG